MMSFRKISSRSGGNGMANNSAYKFVHLLKTICCSGDEKLIVFASEQ
jgi:hypothetical protein